MSSFHVFLDSLQRIVDPKTPHGEISRILLTFQKEISWNSFSIFAQYSELVMPFKTLWEIFIEASKSESTQVRLSLSPAVASFIVRLTPFCAEQMITSFISAIGSNEYHALSSPLIVTAFSVLSKYVAPPLVQNYFTFETLERHIKLINSEFSEFTAKAIGDMEHFGIDWMSKLLAHFLDNLPDDPSRHIVRALGAIIGYNPTSFLNETIKKLKVKAHEFMPTLGSLIASNDYDLRDVDISAFVDTCFETLSNERATFNAVDNALQILAVYQDLKIDVNGENISMSDGKNSVTVLISSLQDKTAFYKLKLPLSLLVPKDGDSGSIVSRKFAIIGETASLMNEDDKRKVTTIFENSIQRKYSDEVSSALRGLSKCINVLNVSNSALKNAVTGRKVSWFHCLDMVTVIDALDVSKVEEGFALTITDLLVDFCLDKNSQLSGEGMRLVTKFITQETFDHVIETILSRMTFFETDHCIRIMEILAKIYHKFPDADRGRCLHVADCALELVEYNSNSLSMLASLFGFLSAFKLDSRKRNVKMAIITAHLVIVEYYEVIAGKIWPSRLNVGECITMRRAVENYLRVHSVDLVSNSKLSTDVMMKPLKSAMEFVFMFDSVMNFNWEICQKMFVLDPVACSHFMLQNMRKLNMSEFVVESSKRLRFVGDIGTFSVWCKITESMKDRDARDTVSLLSVVACYYLHNKSIRDLSLATSFCEFLSKMYENGKDEVTHFIARLSPSQRKYIAEHIKYDNEVLPELVASECQSSYKVPVFAETIADAERELQYSFMTESDEHLARVLKHCESAGITIQMSWLESCPDKYIDTVTNYCMKCAYKAIDMLKYVRTKWKKLAIHVIEDDSNSLLTELSIQQKLKKSTLIDVCACIGLVMFDRSRLLNLSRLIFYEAKKPKRLRPAMRLFTSALQNMCGLSDVIIEDVINAIRSQMPNVSLLEISYCMTVLAEYVTDHDSIYPFIVDVNERWDGTSIAKGNFHSVFLKFSRKSVIETLIGAENTIERFLNSQIPSKYMSGIRQSKEFLSFSGSPELVGAITEIMFSQYKMFMEIPGIAACMSDFVRRLIDSRIYASLYQKIILELGFVLRETPNKAVFVEQLTWMSSAVSDFTNYEQLVRSADLFAKAENISSFELAILVLSAQLVRTPPDQTAIVLMEAFITFLKHHRENYFTRYYLSQFAMLFEVHAFDEFLQFVVKSMHSFSFSTVMLCLEEIVHRMTSGAAVKLLESLIAFTSTDDNQKALAKLLERIKFA